MDLFTTFRIPGVAKGREMMNPRPKIPDTGWKVPKVFPSLADEEVIALDVETHDPGLDPKEDRGPGWGRGEGFIVGIAIAAGRHRLYLPIRHKEEAKDNLNISEVLDYCRHEFGRREQLKTGFNLPYDIGWLSQEGVTVHGNLWCCQTVESQIIKTNSSTIIENNLDAVAKRYLGPDTGKTSDELCRWLWEYYGKGGSPSAAQLNGMRKYIYRTPPRLCGPYAIGDVDLPLAILEQQRPVVEDAGLTTVCDLENALIPVIVAMRKKGVHTDRHAAEVADAKLTIEIGDLQKQINHVAGKVINPGSSAEVGLAFKKLGIHLPTTKTGQYSVAEKVLKNVQHPLAQMVLDIESLKKFQKTFIRGAVLNKAVNNIVYGEFLPLTAITGRFSSRHPNLQNIPSRKAIAKVIRAIFTPRNMSDSSHWRKYDYSSIEARLLAHFAVGVGSKELRDEYNRDPDTDYHNFTQKMIRSVMGIEVERKQVKNINFACIYGGQDKKLASMLGLGPEEGTKFMETYHSALPYIKTTMGYISKVVQEQGETRTILGRRVKFEEWVPTARRKEGESAPVPVDLETAYMMWGSQIKRADSYKGLNYVIQGSAADLMKAAMVMCYEQGIFDVTGIPSLVVHDELDFEVAEQTDDVHKAFEEMVNVMQTAIPFRVPVRVAGEWGMNWSDLEDIAV